MTVVTVGVNVIVRHIKQDQVISIYGCTYFADLYVIPLKGIVVVLGMDWMMELGAQINCEEKTVSIKTPSGARIVYQADKHSHIMVDLQLNSMKEVKLEDIPIVNEFQDVFTAELPGMPPDREIEFTIDLIPGTSPILAVPETWKDFTVYCDASKEGLGCVLMQIGK